jgi:myo-inositol-1(or 4)-monophosphatase
MGTLNDCADRISTAIQRHRGTGLSGRRATQYHVDVVADEAALAVLLPAGFRVLSEESGFSGSGDLTVVIDPVDGSTNCDRGIPFFATSLAVLDGPTLVAGLVVNLATGTRFEAELGRGARRDGTTIAPSGVEELSQAIVSFSGHPAHHLGWNQYRAVGAASLECCLVGDGSLDAFAVTHRSSLFPWDYLAGMLVALEAGGVARELSGQNLVTTEVVERRPVLAATHRLVDAIVDSPEF